ncbi:MAG: translation initiation factor IF-2 [Melioribacteraceae bacterium]|nr:translation initiation factor IF-2 [Melioribacteraceae bacterium]MCF8355850.1 translation initiation factor IF-2 [Melioribacteraceae bacterium]MCF8392575.1 translation initiation factor IF-2 [Melioribacteraceae bacterium]MCF8418553.1 translation initiation factor IF-2 [Melioribacteraceae bacterium]
MSDKPKKLRIYKFASEYNLATESIVEFLQEKGYEVKSHMSLLTDEMIADIGTRFKKDIETAEKHYRKISEFNKKRSDKTEEEVPVEEPAKEPEPEVEKAEPAEEKTDLKEETEEVEEKEEVKEEIKEETAEVKKTSEPEAAAEPEAEKPDEQVEEETVKTYKTEYEKQLDGRKRGLTVVGKMDLNKNKKQRAGKAEEKKKDEKPKAKDEKPAVPPKESKPLSEEEQKKKKKRKKLKAKKKSEVSPEENIKAKKKRKLKKLEVDKREVDAAIKRTMMSMDEAGADRASARKKKRKEKLEAQEKQAEEIAQEKSKLKVTEFIAVNELANLMHVPVSEVIQKCIGLGLMVSINQRLDFETITLVADEFDFDVELQEEFTSETLEDEKDPEETLKPRPPVVTIMGHVDHGKTSLLDYIRKANVVAGEAGGITQHIGAYQVTTDGNKQVTFLDTPGHEAFTAMRARGAKVTDIVVLIVAADDAVMPQTIEAINHAQAAGVPIIIAINKIDKPGANIEKIKQQLAERNVLVEDWGGKYQSVEVSAKQGINVDILLEKILLEAEILELKANPDRLARGTVVESQLDKGRGITATVLVQKGTLRIGDPFVAGNFHGRVRAMFDERNNKIEEASPSTPALVLGFEGAPQAGDTIIAVESEREAREVATKRQQLQREQDHRQIHLLTLDEVAQQAGKGGIKELPLVVKGDVDGSVEALADSLMKLSNEEVLVRVIHKGVGAISEGDVLLAAASRAIIIGFHVRPHTNARKLAEQEKVDIRLYNVIYDAINEVKSALEGMLSPVISEELVATLEIRDTFKVPKIGTVAGCYVQEGKVTRNNKIRLFRDGVVIYEGELATLKRFKDDVKEVDAGYECGLNIANFNDIKLGDIIESYKLVETKKKLN